MAVGVVRQRWRELAEVKEALAQRDWFPATSGNLSIKVEEEPLSILVTASGKDKSKQTLDDFLWVDENGQPKEATHLTPSAETGIHLEIYRRTQAGCCLHVHTVDNNVVSELYAEQGFVTFRRHELLKALQIWEEDGEITIPIVENFADLKLLAQKISEVIRPETQAVLIRNHGVTVWGKNAFEAKRHLEAVEFLFSYHVKLKLLGR